MSTTTSKPQQQSPASDNTKGFYISFVHILSSCIIQLKDLPALPGGATDTQTETHSNAFLSSVSNETPDDLMTLAVSL